MSAPPRLYPRRRRDLSALVRDHPRRSRPCALSRRGGTRRRAHDPCLRHDRPAERRRSVAGLRRARATRRCAAGAPILCDAKMVANGITRARLPADNEVVCTLDDPRVPALAARARQHPHAPPPWSCGASGWTAPSSSFGNAPTALFRLLEMLDARRAAPGRGDRHPGRLRRRGRVEGGAGARRTRAVPRRARPARRQRHGGGRGQRAGERGRMTRWHAGSPAGALRRRPRPRRSGLHDRARPQGCCSAPTCRPFLPSSGTARQRADASPTPSSAEGRIERCALVYPVTDGDPGRASGLRSGHRRLLRGQPPRGSPRELEAGRNVVGPLRGRSRSSTAPSCICGGGWRPLSRSRSCPASPACRAAGRAPARRSPGATTCSPCCPARCREASWCERLRRTDAAVIMKLGRTSAEGPRGAGGRGPAGARDLRRARHHGGRTHRAARRERPTTTAPYFSLITRARAREARCERAGSLTVVGLGPGDAALADAGGVSRRWPPPPISSATAPISTACRERPRPAPPRLRQPRRARPRALRARSRRRGRASVAVVSGGDPGVFAMAAAVFEAVEAAIPHGAASTSGRARRHRDARGGGPRRRAARRRFLRHLALGQSEAVGRRRGAARRRRSAPTS